MFVVEVYPFASIPVLGLKTFQIETFIEINKQSFCGTQFREVALATSFWQYANLFFTNVSYHICFLLLHPWLLKLQMDVQHSEIFVQSISYREFTFHFSYCIMKISVFN